jgi:hypothetical protein
MAQGDDRVRLVLAYIEAAQHARATGETIHAYRNDIGIRVG